MRPTTTSGRSSRDTIASSRYGLRVVAARSAIAARDGVPGRDRVVAVDHLAGDAERLAAIDDAASRCGRLHAGVEMP